MMRIIREFDTYGDPMMPQQSSTAYEMPTDIGVMNTATVNHDCGCGCGGTCGKKWTWVWYVAGMIAVGAITLWFVRKFSK